MKIIDITRVVLHGAVISLLSGIVVASAFADLELPRTSPKAKVAQEIGLTEITVEYFSPAVKKRAIWGELVPFDKIWRTGANNCTKLSLSREAVVGGKNVKEGSYCIFTQPAKNGAWKVMINEDVTLAGTEGYDPKKDVAVFAATPEKRVHRERLAFFFEDVTQTTGNLTLAWENIGLVIPIKVDTNTHALANIDRLKSDSWRDYAFAARYMLEEQKNPERADELITKSRELETTWFNTWVHAQILAAQGKKSEALEQAKEANSMGDNSGFFNFVRPQIESSIKQWS